MINHESAAPDTTVDLRDLGFPIGRIIDLKNDQEVTRVRGPDGAVELKLSVSLGQVLLLKVLPGNRSAMDYAEGSLPWYDSDSVGCDELRRCSSEPSLTCTDGDGAGTPECGRSWFRLVPSKPWCCPASPSALSSVEAQRGELVTPYDELIRTNQECKHSVKRSNTMESSAHLSRRGFLNAALRREWR